MEVREVLEAMRDVAKEAGYWRKHVRAEAEDVNLWDGSVTVSRRLSMERLPILAVFGRSVQFT